MARERLFGNGEINAAKTKARGAFNVYDDARDAIKEFVKGKENDLKTLKTRKQVLVDAGQAVPKDLADSLTAAEKVWKDAKRGRGIPDNLVEELQEAKGKWNEARTGLSDARGGIASSVRRLIFGPGGSELDRELGARVGFTERVFGSPLKLAANNRPLAIGAAVLGVVGLGAGAYASHSKRKSDQALAQQMTMLQQPPAYGRLPEGVYPVVTEPYLRQGNVAENIVQQRTAAAAEPKQPSP